MDGDDVLKIEGEERHVRCRVPANPQRATMGRELMAPSTDLTTRIPSSVESLVTTVHEAKGSMCVSLRRNGGNLPP